MIAGAAARVGDGVFAFGLARAVDAERMARVVLEIGGGLVAVEHIVGGKMHERDAQVSAGARHRRRRVPVQSEGGPGLRLGPVDGGVGGGVDHAGGAGPLDHRRDVAAAEQVELRPAKKREPCPRRRRARRQLAGDLPFAAEHQDDLLRIRHVDRSCVPRSFQRAGGYTTGEVATLAPCPFDG